MSDVFSLTPPSLMILIFSALGVVTITSFLLVVRRPGIKNWNAITGVMVLVLVTAFFGFFTVTSYMINLEISGDELIVRCPPYATKILRKDDVIEAFVIDWNENESYKPVHRTGGTSFGTYKAGWFKLANGATALLVTSSSTNLCIHTTENYYLLLNLQNFNEFLEMYNNTFGIVSIQSYDNRRYQNLNVPKHSLVSAIPQIPLLD